MLIAHPDIRLRPVTDADLNLLKQIYSSTREAELAQTDWSDIQKSVFVEMQFHAQHRAYCAYSNTKFFLILYQEKPVGRIYIQHKTDALHIIDLSILTSFRCKGIGSGVLCAVVEEAHQLDLPIQIHVEKFNPALVLYQRLGFRLIGDKGVYVFLEWNKKQNTPLGVTAVA